MFKRNPDVLWREEQEGQRKVLDGADSEKTPCMTLVHLGTMYQLNFVAAEVWKLCDGQHGVRDIVEELLPRLDINRTDLEKDVISFIEEMSSKGWLVRN